MLKWAASLVCISIALLATFLLKIHVASEAQRIQRISKDLSESIYRSSHDLEVLLNSLSQRLVFTSAVGEGRIHSLAQQFSGEIRQGQVSALSIQDSACQTLARFGLPSLPSSSCLNEHKGQDDVPQILSNPKTGLYLQRQISIKVDERDYWLKAAVLLDHHWFQKSPDLGVLFERSILRFGDKAKPFEYVIRDQVFLPPLAPSAFLKTSYIGAKALNLTTSDKLASYFNFTLLILVALFAALLFVGVRSYVSLTNSVSQLYQWLDSLKSTTPDAVSLQAISSKILSHSSQVNSIKTLVAQIVSQLIRQLQHSNSERQSQKAKIEQLTLEIAEVRLALAEAPIHISMVDQVQAQSEHLKLEIYKIQSLLQDVSDVLKNGLCEELKKVQAVAEHWERGCRKTSPRSFLRHLSERPLGKSNQLDMELTLLGRSTSRAVTIALNLALQSRKVLRKSVHVTNILEHYQSLEGLKGLRRTGDSSSLRHAMERAVEMAQPQVKFHKILIAFGSDQWPDPEHLPVPAFVWQSLFYHSVLALYHFWTHQVQARPSVSVRSENPTWPIEVDLIQRDRKSFLVIDVGRVELQGSLEKINSQKAHQQIELARMICKDLPLKVAFLPHLRDHMALAISWESSSWESIDLNKRDVSNEVTIR